MTVYVDVLLLINTMVNYFMLLGVKLITRCECGRLRLIWGAVAGGVSSLTVLWNGGAFITLIKIFTAFLMVLISFPLISLKAYLKKCVWLFIIGFLFSGVCLAAYLLLDTDLMIYSNGTVYFDVDITFLTVCTVVSYLVISVIMRFTDKRAPKNQYYPITVVSGEKTVTLKGFMDTGNNLKEPFSFYPVVVVGEGVYRELYSACKTLSERVIPTSSASGDGVIYAFRPDKVIFLNKEIHNVYIGKGSVPEGCDVLLCPDLLGENYEKTEKIT